MANTALSPQSSEADEQEPALPFRIDREGFALLRNRLRSANTANPRFELQHQRIVALLHMVLHRLTGEFGDQIELVVADGDWARYGIDLRNLPFDDVVLLIVVRGRERPFSLYWEIADRVFTTLGDKDVLMQFRLATLGEWEAGSAFARQRGEADVLGIPLLARAG